jgi:hypothetical protein
VAVSRNPAVPHGITAAGSQGIKIAGLSLRGKISKILPSTFKIAAVYSSNSARCEECERIVRGDM